MLTPELTDEQMAVLARESIDLHPEFLAQAAETFLLRPDAMHPKNSRAAVGYL